MSKIKVIFDLQKKLRLSSIFIFFEVVFHFCLPFFFAHAWWVNLSLINTSGNILLYISACRLCPYPPTQNPFNGKSIKNALYNKSYFVKCFLLVMLYMEDNLIFFLKYKTTSLFWQMRDNLDILANRWWHQYFGKWKRPQYFGKWKTTLILCKWKMTSICWEI